MTQVQRGAQVTACMQTVLGQRFNALVMFSHKILPHLKAQNPALIKNNKEI